MNHNPGRVKSIGQLIEEAEQKEKYHHHSEAGDASPPHYEHDEMIEETERMLQALFAKMPPPSTNGHSHNHHQHQPMCYTQSESMFTTDTNHTQSLKPYNRYKIQLCNNHMECGVCPRATQCTYAHGLQELQGFDVWKTQICKRHQQGYCKYGPMCRYAHGGHEIRNRDDSSLNKTLKFLLSEREFLVHANQKFRGKVQQRQRQQTVDQNPYNHQSTTRKKHYQQQGYPKMNPKMHHNSQRAVYW